VINSKRLDEIERRLDLLEHRRRLAPRPNPIATVLGEFKYGDVIRCIRTGECMSVEGAPVVANGTSTMRVTRGIGSVAPTDFDPDVDEFEYTGNVYRSIP
jgi:hypothetical protein